MTGQDDIWRNRFIAMNLLRIGATFVVLFGILLWQSDVIVEGGNVIGFPLAFIALVVSFFGPKWLAGRWQRPPDA
ncbi:MAG: hypothetical protein KF780_00540 [Sphingomonas sp.]|nr:hypothetical protein [Sphingomonas sp.]